MKNILKIATIAAITMVPAQAFAVTGNVPFNGSITHTCTINVQNAGTLVANAGFTSMSSELGGGAAGTAEIVATGNTFQVSIDAPSAFTSEPAADASAETFEAKFDASGATTTNGTASGGSSSTGDTLNMGTTNVNVNLAANKSGTDVFEAGAYEAVVVLRCE